VHVIEGKIDFLRRCLNCGLPESYETLEFDRSGIEVRNAR